MRKNDLEKTKVLKTVGENVKSAAPAVSVVTPAYNVAGFIAETLQSVLAQTFTDYEIIVINDGSPDTAEFEKALAPFMSRIVYLKQENTGAGLARNAAIEHARGELIAFLDGDDLWHADFLESQINFLRAGDYDLVYPDALLFGGSPMDGKTYMQDAPSRGVANFDSILDLTCHVITSGAVARKQTILDAGMFEKEEISAHDFLLWLKMAKNGARIGYQKKVLLKYRVRADSLSGDSIKRIERSIDAYNYVMKKMELSRAQRRMVERLLAGYEADLQVENGKLHLLRENFAAAAESFAKANEHRKSMRLRSIVWLARFAPRFLLKFYQTRRADEIGFIPVAGK